MAENKICFHLYTIEVTLFYRVRASYLYVDTSLASTFEITEKTILMLKDNVLCIKDISILKCRGDHDVFTSTHFLYIFMKNDCVWI